MPNGRGLAQPQLARLAMVLHRGGDRDHPRQGRGRHRDRGPDKGRRAKAPPILHEPSAFACKMATTGPGRAPGGFGSFGARPSTTGSPSRRVSAPIPASSLSTRRPACSSALSRRSPNIWVSSTPCAGQHRSQVLVIAGASGSGKSSLVRAGLIPHLRRKPEWIVISSFEVARDPLRNLLDRRGEALDLLRVLPGAGVDAQPVPGQDRLRGRNSLDRTSGSCQQS